MQATLRNIAGEEVGQVELDDYVFGITPNMAVIQQAVVRQQANARQGTHDTKTRAQVRGGGRKPWRQKGTGRARQGSTRAPQWTHGGVVFGPHPRSYVQQMPRKMRRLAIRSVLSAKAADGQIVLVDSFEGLEPRTKAFQQVLTSLNVAGSSALIMTAAPDDNLDRAASNLPRVSTMPAYLLSVVDMLKHDYLLISQASLDVIHSILSQDGSQFAATSKERIAIAAQENVAFEPTGEVAEAAEATTADEEATAEEAVEVEEVAEEPAESEAQIEEVETEEVEAGEAEEVETADTIEVEVDEEEGEA